jgi:death-on-curing protein
MERINLADFLVIAELHTRIDAHQLARIDRVVQLAESALAAPFAGYGDHELYPGFADRAAIYASRIARNHPLPDGNKRTAYDVMIEFIERNGGTFEHPPDGLMATAEMIERLAARTITEDAIDSAGNASAFSQPYTLNVHLCA